MHTNLNHEQVIRKVIFILFFNLAKNIYLVLSVRQAIDVHFA